MIHLLHHRLLHRIHCYTSYNIHRYIIYTLYTSSSHLSPHTISPESACRHLDTKSRSTNHVSSYRTFHISEMDSKIDEISSVLDRALMANQQTTKIFKKKYVCTKRNGVEIKKKVVILSIWSTSLTNKQKNV